MWILLSIALIFGGALLSAVMVTIPAPSDIWIKIVFEALRLIGASLIVVGFVEVILSIPLFRKFFDERLANLFSDDKFLNLLGKGKLKQIFRDSLKIIHKSKDIEKADSLFNLVNNQILSYLSRPYRDNFSETISMEKIDNKHFKTTVTISFDYKIDSKDIKKSDYQWEIWLDKSTDQCDLFKLEYFKINKEIVQVEIKEEDIENNRYHILINKADIDLPAEIEIKAVFCEKIVKSQYRSVKHPTRNASYQLVYPKGENFNGVLFEMIRDPKNAPVVQDCSIKISTKRWLLPGHGVILYWDEKK